MVCMFQGCVPAYTSACCPTEQHSLAAVFTARNCVHYRASEMHSREEKHHCCSPYSRGTTCCQFGKRKDNFALPLAGIKIDCVQPQLVDIGHTQGKHPQNYARNMCLQTLHEQWVTGSRQGYEITPRHVYTLWVTFSSRCTLRSQCETC
jgi:hypothetical protein